MYIYDDVVNAIFQHARKNLNVEVAGLLIGEKENEVIVVKDIVRWEGVSGKADRVIIDSSFLARVADDIVKGRIRGRIVGWYHSHPGLGVFMSIDDLKTHQTLQQFDPNIISIVVDPILNQIGYFKQNPLTRNVELFKPQIISRMPLRAEMPEKSSGKVIIAVILSSILIIASLLLGSLILTVINFLLSKTAKVAESRKLINNKVVSWLISSINRLILNIDKSINRLMENAHKC
jgi:proteasome lid subunit RPN8/RPN11